MAMAFRSTTPERLVAGPDGALELLTAGSTRPVAVVVTHARIARTQRSVFSLPRLRS